jgi:hypothetical protein
VDGQTVQIVGGAIDNRPGFASSFHCRIEHGVHGIIETALKSEGVF